jgi:uncharacterized protein YdaL
LISLPYLARFCMHELLRSRLKEFMQHCLSQRNGEHQSSIHKSQIHHVIFYLECNLQFPFFFLPLIFSYLNNVKWIEYVLMTICNFSCVFFRKRINISVTLVSESYVTLYCEKNVICNSSIEICLNQSLFVHFHQNGRNESPHPELDAITT